MGIFMISPTIYICKERFDILTVEEIMLHLTFFALDIENYNHYILQNMRNHLTIYCNATLYNITSR